MPRFKVVITDFDYGDNDDRARDPRAGRRARSSPCRRRARTICSPRCRDCDAVMNQYARVGAKAIAAMQRCKVIARYGVGVDIVDVEAATEARHPRHQRARLLHRGGGRSCHRAVARACAQALAVRSRHASRAYGTGSRVSRSIGCATRRWASSPSARSARRSPSAHAASACEILAYDPYLPPKHSSRARGVEPVSKDELLSQSDCRDDAGADDGGDAAFSRAGRVRARCGRARSSSTPAADRPSTTRRSTMRSSSGRIAGAGLDDPEEEPAKRADWSPRDNPLFSLPNVIVTPHSAYYSEESIRIARETAASEVARVLTGERPHNPVNNVPAAAVSRASASHDRGRHAEGVQRFRAPARPAGEVRRGREMLFGVLRLRRRACIAPA